MKYNLLALLLISSLLQSIPSSAQNSDFDKFRKSMMADFDNYRNKILDDYSDFIESIWIEYDLNEGRKFSNKPKPKVQPIKSTSEDIIYPVKPLVADSSLFDIPQIKDIPAPKPATPEKPSSQLPCSMPKPGKKMVPTEFYGLRLTLPHINITSNCEGTKPEMIAAYWSRINDTKDIAELCKSLTDHINTLSLNDWCTYLLIKQYSGSIISDHNSRSVLEAYLLTMANLDIRLALADNRLLIIANFEEQIYARPFIVIDRRNYFVISETTNVPSISTYNVAEIEGIKPMRLKVTQPVRLPYKAKQFNISDGVLSINGKVNENLINLLSSFPQMDIPDYASSSIEPELRRDIVDQLKLQLSGKNELEAVDCLLGFVQRGFEYATDQEQFGYEKPFFLEEILFYPKCDCEDRAVFYAYLLRNVLDKDCHLINYPNHEAVGVNINDAGLNGTSYVFRNKRYFISDPTFIGSRTGQCMPVYSGISPKIENW